MYMLSVLVTDFVITMGIHQDGGYTNDPWFITHYAKWVSPFPRHTLPWTPLVKLNLFLKSDFGTKRMAAPISPQLELLTGLLILSNGTPTCWLGILLRHFDYKVTHSSRTEISHHHQDKTLITYQKHKTNQCYYKGLLPRLCVFWDGFN